MQHGSLDQCLCEVLFRDDRLPMWRRESIESAADMARVIETVAAAMDQAGHGRKAVFAARMALEEAIANAHKHGHGGTWDVPVVVRYHVGVEAMAAEVEDQGPGFDPVRISDPLARENLDHPSGRGVLLMRAYMSCVCFNERGNRVCMSRRRCDAPVVMMDV